MTQKERAALREILIRFKSFWLAQSASEERREADSLIDAVADLKALTEDR